MNVRVRQIGDRAVVEGINRQFRDHAWRCLESQGGIEIQLGLVNEMEPFIAGRPMSGFSKAGVPDRRGPPLLVLAGSYPIYICIRVVVDKDGKLAPGDLSPSTLSIVATGTPQSTDERVGFHAIAVVRMLGGVPDLHQIGRFDYQHYTSRDSGGRLRHHFDIA